MTPESAAHANTLNWSWVGDAALRIELSRSISPETSARVHRLHDALRSRAWPGLLDLTPAYASLLATFDPAQLDPARVEQELAQLGSGPDLIALPSAPPRVIDIPVCYEGELAPDLASVAAYHGIAPSRVVELHSQSTYTVAFLGFSPGFPYLLGLPDALRTPRLDSPRSAVPAGSVGIAGSQTGIYPASTPGGWRLIGRTPRRIFNPARDEPALLQLGDRVRFLPIDRASFNALAQEER